MVKNSVKKIKKVKKSPVKDEPPRNGGDEDVKEEEGEDMETDKVEKSDNAIFKDLKKQIIADTAYITDLLSVSNFPKRQESDDESDDDTVTNTKGKGRKFGSSERASNISELRERLRAKIESLATNKGGKATKKAKLSREEVLQKKREAKRLKAKLAKAAKAGTVVAPSGSNAKAKPVFDSEGKMVFSKFDFTGQKKASEGKRDAKAALKALEKQKAKIKSLEDVGDTGRARQAEENEAWANAMDKSEGVKVKDDAGLLKKTIKRQEQKKKSSKKKWDGRKEAEDKRKESKQLKRTENINKRKKEKRDTKMKKLAKKGRVPGFR